MTDDAGLRSEPSGLRPETGDRPVPDWVAKNQRARVQGIKADLLTRADFVELQEKLGTIIGDLIDRKLEAKALEMLDRHSENMIQTHRILSGDTSNRDQLSISRAGAAKLLQVSLSTIKRMETSGELPEPFKFSERVVRHRLIDVEAIARVRGTICPD